MILDEICAHKRQEVAAAKKARPQQTVESAAADMRPALDFRTALRLEGMSLIAEIKRASPSKGVMLEDLDPISLGCLYEQAGARAISILTDEKYFRGSLEDLSLVRQNVSIPVLRKEFIVDPYQIYEARAAGADALLLIVRVLDDAELRDFLDLTRELGMSSLVEVHDAHEAERAIEARARIIGVNNRDLATFTVDLNTTFELKKLIPGGHVLVAESGIHTRDHVKMLEDGGVDAILVGEALVTSNNIFEKIQEMIGVPAH